MKITSSIPSCRLNWLGLVLSPLLWVRHYIGELGEMLEGMIWDELIHNRVEDDSLTHLWAFLVFSGFCLWANYQGMMPYVDVLLVALLPMQSLVDRHGFAVRRDGKVSLELQPGRLVWAGQGRLGMANGEFTQAQIDVVVIRCALVSLGFGQEAELGWDVLIRLHGESPEYLLHREPDWRQAWERAATLARTLGVQVKVADSLGLGEAAEMQTLPVRPAHEDYVWRVKAMAGGATIYRNWTTLGIWARLRGWLNDGGYLLFVMVLNTVMAKYGAFLMWMLGPRLGLTEPTTLYLDLSFQGMLGFFVPEWNVMQSGLLALALVLAGVGSYRQGRPQELKLAERNLFYRREGFAPQILRTEDISQLLMVFAPRPLLLVWSDSQAPLVVDGLRDEGELDEVYAKLLAGLRTLRPSDQRWGRER